MKAQPKPIIKNVKNMHSWEQILLKDTKQEILMCITKEDKEFLEIQPGDY